MASRRLLPWTIDLLSLRCSLLMANWLILAPIALGHFCLTVLAVNIFHGFGFEEQRLMPRIKPFFFSVLGLTTLVLCWAFLRNNWQDWSPILQGYALLCLGIALIGLPADLMARQLRRGPENVSGRAEPIELVPPSELSSLIGDSKDAWWLRLPGNQSLHPIRTDWEIQIPGLAEPLEGLRILQWSDLHLHPGYSRKFYEALADHAETLEADLVLFTGDLMDDETALEWASPILSRLRGRLGQFAILGNHDARFDREKPTQALLDAGFEVIEGTWAHRELEGASIALGGTSYPWGPLPDPKAMPEADFRILLSHSPDNFSRAQDWGINLVLAGHTHGGQYRLPMVGPVILPSRYSRRFDAGFFRKGQTLMYVSRGLAAQHPLRIRCSPEFSQFVLQGRPNQNRPVKDGESEVISQASVGS